MRDRRSPQALQRVDLLGDPHRAQLGGIARADATRQDQPREHRAQLEDDGFRDHEPDDVDRQVAAELVAGLEAGHGAGEPGNQQDDEQAAVADAHGLLERARQVDAPLGEPAKQIEHQKGETPGVTGGVLGRMPHCPSDPAQQLERGVHRDRAIMMACILCSHAPQVYTPTA